MNHNEFELILGILCLILSFILFYLEIKEWKNIEIKDYMLKANSIKIISGAIVFLIAGIAGIYRYLF